MNTAETVRVRYFMDMLMSNARPVMLVGTSGCGKTVMMNNKLESLNSDDYVIANVPFNFYTTSEMLQTVNRLLSREINYFVGKQKTAQLNNLTPEK